MDPLDRFLVAQAPIFDTALAELRAGHKRSHWMWFVFPQLRGLGTSERAHRYGLAGLDEASAYLAHPVLGPRLRDCAAAVLAHPGRTARDIFGTPDDLKFRSSMTLFSRAAPGPEGEPFRRALADFFEGREDPRALSLLGLA